jgi:vanillate O-demethylase ferredoxin subunit
MSEPVDEVNGGAFEVVLARRQQSVTVEPGQSILQALQEAGLEVPFSCGEGICGTCMTAVKEGVPEHWDMYLTPEEQEKNDCMMICISRSKSKKLVLDL